MSTRDEMLASIEICWPEAIWVLGAHACALFIPLVLYVAVHAHNWVFTGAIILGVIVAVAALSPPLTSLPTSPRIIREPADSAAGH